MISQRISTASLVLWSLVVFSSDALPTTMNSNVADYYHLRALNNQQSFTKDDLHEVRSAAELRVDTSVNSFEELKFELERCGCNCSLLTSSVDLSNVSSLEFTDTVTISSSCNNATIIGRSNFSEVVSSWPNLNMTGGRLFVEGSTESDTLLRIERARFTIGQEHGGGASIINIDAALNLFLCTFDTNGVFPVIQASGTGRSNITIDSCLFISPPTSYPGCPYFNFTAPVGTLAVADSIFVFAMDQDFCLDGASIITTARNQLVMPNYHDTARMIEMFPYNTPTLLGNDGSVIYIQLDAFNETQARTVKARPIVNISIEVDLSYGDQQDLVISTESLGEISTSGVPDFVQITSSKSAVCVEAIRVSQGDDVLVNLQARIFESCSAVCSLPSSPSTCWSKIFTYDPNQKCLLISPERSIHVNIDLNTFYCSRLIPPRHSPYVLRAEATRINSVDTIDIVVHETPFINASVSLSGMPFKARLSNKIPPQKLTIKPPVSRGKFCLSRVILERDSDTTWVDIPLAAANACLQDSCTSIYDTEAQCLILSNEIGAYEALTIDFSKENCEKFVFTRAGGPSTESICHKTLAVNSTEMMRDAIDMLNDKVFSSLLLNMSDLVDTQALSTLSLAPQRHLEVNYVGDPSGNRTLLSGSSRLFLVEQGASLVLSGFVIQRGGIDNNGGVVQLVDMTFLEAYSSLDQRADESLSLAFSVVDGGTILNRNNGTLEVFVSTFSGSRSMGNGGSIATIDGSTTSIVRSHFKNSSAIGNGQILFNCRDCVTQIDAATLDGENILFNEAGGKIVVVGRLRLVQPTNFLSPGSERNISFEDVSRLAQIFPPEEWCAGNITSQVLANVTFKVCEENCLSNGPCEAVAFEKQVGTDLGGCSLCKERPCGFNCSNATSFYVPKELFKFAAVNLTSDRLCLTNPQEVGVGVEFPLVANTTRTCQEACGFFDACKIAHFRDADQSCKLYGSASFTDAGGSICEGLVFFKYRGTLTQRYTPLSSNGCFQNKSSLLGNVSLSARDIDEKCEAICLSNPLCRAFRTRKGMCEINDAMWFEDNCTYGGKIFIDVRSESFPKKEYVSFSSDVTKNEGTKSNSTNAIASLGGCQRLCNEIAECKAVVFNKEAQECITFNEDQLSDGLFEGDEIEDIFVALRLTEASQLEEGDSISGCVALNGFSSIQPAGFAGTFSEQDCTTACYFGPCDFFIFNLTSSTCDFFTNKTNPLCTKAQNISWSSETQRAWEVKREVDIIEDYYEAKNKCILQRQVEDFQFDVAALNVGKNNSEPLCKELCTSFRECIAVIFDNRLPGIFQCTLLSRLVVVGKGINGTCTVGSLFDSVHISLSKVNELDSFLTVPSGACPLSRAVDFVSPGLCFPPNPVLIPPFNIGDSSKGSKKSKSSKKTASKKSKSTKDADVVLFGKKEKSQKSSTVTDLPVTDLPDSLDLPVVINSKKAKANRNLALNQEEQNWAVRRRPRGSSRMLQQNSIQVRERFLQNTPKNITQKIVTLMMGDERDCEKSCVNEGSCQAFTWEEPQCTLEKRASFDDCSNLDLDYFRIIYFRPEFNGLSESPNISLSEPALESAGGIADQFSCEGLCNVFSDCGGVIYNQTTSECVVLSSCESALSNGRDPLTCLETVYRYDFFKLQGFCLQETDLSCKKLTDVFRLDHCMAYCDAWYGCSTFVYNATSLTCDLYENFSSLRPPRLVESSEAASCLGGTLYMSSAHSPRPPFRSVPNSSTNELCLSGRPGTSDIANSPAACFEYFCRSTNGCFAFTFDQITGSCVLYSSNTLTTNCTSPNTMNTTTAMNTTNLTTTNTTNTTNTTTTYVLTDFDADEVANTTALSIRQIFLSQEIECAIVCESFPSCNAYIFLPDVSQCQLVNTNSTFESAGSSITPLGKATRLLKIEGGRRLVETNRIISSFAAAEWFCLWLCDITVECDALEYNNQNQGCGIFGSRESVEDTSSSNSIDVWIVDQNATRPGTGSAFNPANSLKGKPVAAARDALKVLSGKIDVLERKARPLIGNLVKVSVLTSSTVETLETILKPLNSLEEDVDDVLVVIKPINIILTVLAKSPVKPIKALITATKIDKVLKSVERVLQRGGKVVDRAGKGTDGIRLPFELIDTAVFTVVDFLDMFSPPAFLRDLTLFLKTLLACVEEVGNIELRTLVTRVIELLCEGVTLLIGIMDTLTDLSNKIIGAISDLERRLRGDFKEQLRAFAGALKPIRDLFLDTFPFNQLTGLLDRTIMRLPIITVETQTIEFDFGPFGKPEITIPMIGVAGELCLPFAGGVICDILNGGVSFLAGLAERIGQGFVDIGCSVANTLFGWAGVRCEPPKVEINIEGIINSVLGGWLQGITGTEIGPRIDLDQCLACLSFSPDAGIELTMNALIEYVGRAIETISQWPIISFVLDTLDLLIETALRATGIEQWFPEFPLAIPDLIDFDDLINLDFLSTAKDEIEASTSKIIESPTKLLEDIFEPLGNILDSLPCNISGKLGDFMYNDVNVDATNSTDPSMNRRLQGRGSYSEFDSIARISGTMKGVLTKRIQSFTGRPKSKNNVPNRKARKNQGGKFLPTAFATNSDWLVDPRYLLEQGTTNDYDRVAVGASVFITPSPDKYNDKLRLTGSERKNYVLLSYLTEGSSGDVVNNNVCVNKIEGDGRVNDNMYDGKRNFDGRDRAQMSQSGFSSDFVYDVRIDFVADSTWGNTRIQKLVLEVVEDTEVVGSMQRRCVGCKRGAGCITVRQGSTIKFQGTKTEQGLSAPENTRSFLALYHSPFARDIFYDKETFGFFLSQNSFGVGDGNSNDPGCAVFRDTGGFRNNWLPNGRYDRENLPDSDTARGVDCTSSFEMNNRGAIENSRTNRIVSGTFWAEEASGLNTRLLFGCAGDRFKNIVGDDYQSSDVEHIIEESALKSSVESPFPLVDFVMAWAFWNKDNGSFRINRNSTAAEKEKSVLYGDEVYRCIDALLGGMVEGKSGVPTDSCKSETWASQVCQSALEDIFQRRLGLSIF